MSCGPTNGLNDFIDAVYVGPFQSGSITNVRLRPSESCIHPAQITFAVGDQPALACPSGYLQNTVNLNDGSGGKFINTCYTYNPEFGAPIAAIATVAGAFSARWHIDHAARAVLEHVVSERL